MSDMDEDDFMQDDDEVDFDFEYEDDANGSLDADVENQYYNAKGLREDDIPAAIAQLQLVVDHDRADRGEWGFRALKQLIKIRFAQHRLPDILPLFRDLTAWSSSPRITRNHADKSVNNILDLLSTAGDAAFLHQLYSIALDSLASNTNTHVWVRTNLKLAHLLLLHRDYHRLTRTLHQLYAQCASSDAADSQVKGTLLLELYALEIQMYTATKRHKKLKTLYRQCLRVKSAVPHPRIMGVIRECGGKMHMSEGSWEKAQIDFFEAFRNYDEAGDPRRIQCLKYMVLANMLMESTINPFDSQETKPYQNHKDVVAMLDLVNAYQRKDIDAVNHVLSSNRAKIMGDPFIETYISDLLRSIRIQVLLSVIQPYTRVKLGFIAEQVDISQTEVESLLVKLILDGKLVAQIDQVGGNLILESISKDSFNVDILNEWVRNIENDLIYPAV